MGIVSRPRASISYQIVMSPHQNICVTPISLSHLHFFSSHTTILLPKYVANEHLQQSKCTCSCRATSRSHTGKPCRLIPIRLYTQNVQALRRQSIYHTAYHTICQFWGPYPTVPFYVVLWNLWFRDPGFTWTSLQPSTAPHLSIAMTRHE